MGWKFWERDTSEAEQTLARLQREEAAPSVQAPPAQVPSEGSGSFSMPVEDVFSITGRGTVATGRITAGSVNVGDSVMIRTANGSLTSTVTGVEMFRRVVTTATTGENVGLLLDGVSRSDFGPGDTITG